MKLEIELTQSEIDDFLMSKGYTSLVKKMKKDGTYWGEDETVPQGSVAIVTEWVTDVAGFEHPKYEIFNKLMKKRLLEW